MAANGTVGEGVAHRDAGMRRGGERATVRARPQRAHFQRAKPALTRRAGSRFRWPDRISGGRATSPAAASDVIGIVADAPEDRQSAIGRCLTTDRNLWLTTLRADGSPHVTPIWFVWDGRAFWLCTSGDNVKVRNLRRDPRVALALEDGDRPVVA